MQSALLLQSRREHRPGEDAVPGLLEHLAQHGRAVDAVLRPQPFPLAVDRVDAAGTAGRGQEEERGGERGEERG